MFRQDKWRRESVLAAAICLALMLAPIVASTPAAADTSIGKFISRCSGASIEPVCLSNLAGIARTFDETDGVCIPRSVTGDQAGHAMLDYLRQEIAAHPEIANDEDYAEVEGKAAAALWPCRK